VARGRQAVSVGWRRGERRRSVSGELGIWEILPVVVRTVGWREKAWRQSVTVSFRFGPDWLVRRRGTLSLGRIIRFSLGRVCSAAIFEH
jgi:hypothetical protein